MHRKAIAIITLIVLTTGCMNNSQPTNNTFTPSPIGLETIPTPSSDVFNYDNYAKITWVDKTDTENSSFCITDITDGKITGIFVPGNVIYSPRAVPSQYSYDYGKFTGTISDGKADCQFSAVQGIEGSLLLAFEPDKQINATITLSEKSQYANPNEGTFQYIPYNINDTKEFKIIESQSFMVDLNSWGNVRFVSVVNESPNHQPTLFYLTDEDGNFLYDFNADIPYLVDVEAVSFVDVNDDELIDVIILVKPQDESGLTAAFFKQTTDGAFFQDHDLNSALNTGDNNKDIKTIVEYLSNNLPKGVQPPPHHP